MPLLKNITPGTHKHPLLCKKAFNKNIDSVARVKAKTTIIRRTFLVNVELNAFSLAQIMSYEGGFLYLKLTTHTHTLITRYLQLTRQEFYPNLS